MDKIISQGKSSALLYLYQYIPLLVMSFALHFWIKILAGIPLVLMWVLFKDARTMHYELTAKELYISPSFLDRETTIVKLEDVKGFYVVDRQPWSFFELGTVLVIVDLDADAHPCIKCIKDPFKLAKTIKKYALENGARIHPNFDFAVI